MFETMKNLIAGFPSDLEKGIVIASQFDTENLQPFSNVLISGLGGSGIGGTIVSELVANETAYPIQVNNDYAIPNWVNEKTLFIACSYSGNTEETLAATEEAIERGCVVVCISSGGKILDIAFENALPFIQIPEGYPPRTALSYSLCAIFGVLVAYQVIGYKPWQDLLDAAQFLKENQAVIQQKAENLAPSFKDKIPAIYAAQGYAGVAVRWRQQINENAKMLCWHHILPEMNHNELVGWAGGSEQIGVLILRTADDHPRTQLRMDLCEKLFKDKTNTVESIVAEGDTLFKRVFYLINLGDWLSYYLSIARSVDPIEVKVIDFLKNELSQH
jgi:glucose/mannose-6-phosphate isomerase